MRTGWGLQCAFWICKFWQHFSLGGDFEINLIWACSAWEYVLVGSKSELATSKLDNFRLGNFQLGYISDLATSDLATFLTWLTWQRLTWHHLTWFLVLVFGFWFLVFGFYRKGGQHMHIKIQITVVSVPHLMLPRFLLRRPTTTNNLTTIISDIFIRWSGENTQQDNGWGRQIEIRYEMVILWRAIEVQDWDPTESPLVHPHIALKK